MIVQQVDRMDALFSVADQVVLISGGTRGIGRAIAAGFATRGARVIVTGRELANADAAAKELSAETGAAIVGLGCDVAVSADISALVARVLQDFGRIETLINVAG